MNRQNLFSIFGLGGMVNLWGKLKKKSRPNWEGEPLQPMRKNDVGKTMSLIRNLSKCPGVTLSTTCPRTGETVKFHNGKRIT